MGWGSESGGRYRRVVTGDGLAALVAEQIAYYRALAPEYLAHALDMPGGGEIEGALDRFAPTGDVLELACGPDRGPRGFSVTLAR
jgi:hypothetical protein